MCFPQTVKADSVFFKTEATAYCITGKTATGTYTQEGRTAAGRPEWFGKTLIIWIDDGSGQIKAENYIGTYVCEDTGGEKVRNGVLDIYIKDYDRAMQFGRKQVIVQLISAEG